MVEASQERWFSGLWTYESVASGRKLEALLCLGMSVKVWRLRALVNSQRPMETKFRIAFYKGFEVYIGLTKGSSKGLIFDRLQVGLLDLVILSSL